MLSDEYLFMLTEACHFHLVNGFIHYEKAGHFPLPAEPVSDQLTCRLLTLEEMRVLLADIMSGARADLRLPTPYEFLVWAAQHPRAGIYDEVWMLGRSVADPTRLFCLALWGRTAEPGSRSLHGGWFGMRRLLQPSTQFLVVEHATP